LRILPLLNMRMPTGTALSAVSNLRPACNYFIPA
jgi:hypothetical protein